MRFWRFAAALLVMSLAGAGCAPLPRPAPSPAPEPSPLPRAYGVVKAVDAEAQKTDGGRRTTTHTYRARVLLRVRYQVGAKSYTVDGTLPWQDGHRGTRDGARLAAMGEWPVGRLVQAPYDPAHPEKLAGPPEPLPYTVPKDKVDSVDMSGPLESWIRKAGEPIGGFPDLQTARIDGPVQGRVGEPLQFRVRVDNLGRGVSGGPRLVVREGGRTLAQRSFRGALESGRSVFYRLRWTPGRAGRTVLEFQVNPDAEVWETHLDDNLTRYEVQVAPGPSHGAAGAVLSMETAEQLPDLQIEGLKPRSAPRVGEEVWMEFGVANRGMVRSGGAVLALLVDGKEVGRVASKSLVRPGESAPERIAWTPAAAGPHTLRAVVDPDRALNEQDDENNSQEHRVEVAP